MEPIKAISIVHSASRNFKEALDQCLKTAKSMNVDVKGTHPVNEDDIEKSIKSSKSNLVIVIGGDGTMIRTIANLIENEIPMLGINIGRLGFLTDLSVDSISKTLPKVFSGDYLTEKRPSLSI